MPHHTVEHTTHPVGSDVASPGVWRAVEQVMGMPVSIALRGRHAGTSRGLAAWHRVIEALRQVDRDFSPYRPDSLVSRIDASDLDPDDAGPAMAEVLAVAGLARKTSGGAFDVWRTDESGQRRFDPSGVVKGWATQQAALLLRELPETDSCLSAGGDITCWVADPDASDPWEIGVEDPHDPRRLVARIPLHRGAVATSGLNHRGHHVTDARTGLVPRSLASITVVADDLTTADVAATTAVALDTRGVAWLRRHGLRAVAVTVDGTVSVC